MWGIKERRNCKPDLPLLDVTYSRNSLAAHLCWNNDFIYGFRILDRFPCFLYSDSPCFLYYWLSLFPFILNSLFIQITYLLCRSQSSYIRLFITHAPCFIVQSSASRVSHKRSKLEGRYLLSRFSSESRSINRYGKTSYIRLLKTAKPVKRSYQ